MQEYMYTNIIFQITAKRIEAIDCTFIYMRKNIVFVNKH